EPGLDQIREHAAHELFVVVTEALENLSPARDGPRAYEVVDRFPQGAASLGRALAEALHLPLIAAKSHPEHVGAHFLVQTLRLELARELDEHLVCDVSQRSTEAAARGELGDEDDGLADDRAYQQRDVHDGSLSLRRFPRQPPRTPGGRERGISAGDEKSG